MPVPTLTGFVRRLAIAGEPDDALVRRFVDARSEAAFEELVRRYGPAVFGVCRRALGDHHLAEDAFQAVFVVLARKAHAIRPPGDVGRWLYGVARKAAVEAQAMRRRKHREALPGTLPERPTDTPEPDDAGALVDAEIADLPETLRSAVLLCEIEGVSRAEAAGRLGIAPGTLSSRLARARKLLGERLRRRGVALGVAGAVALPNSLAKAAASRADGRASGTVLELANGVLRTMLLTTLKPTTVAILCVVLAAGAVFAVAPATPRASTTAPQPTFPGTQKAPTATPVPKKQPEWRLLFTLKHDAEVTAVAASGEMVAVTGVGFQLRLWGAADGKELDLPVRGAQSLTPADVLQFAANDSYLVMSARDTVFRYEQRAGGMVCDTGIFDGFTPLGWSADLNSLLTRKAGRPNVLFLHGNVWADPKNLLRASAAIEMPGDVAITHAALSGDDRRLAAAGDDSVIRIYDRGSLRELHQFKLKKGQKLTAVRLSADGKRLAVVGEAGLANVLDTADSTGMCDLKGHDGTVAAVAFSPDGKRVATAEGKVVRVFDAESGKPVGKLTGHGGDVKALAFSPDGKRLVTGSADKTAKVWELKE